MNFPHARLYAKKNWPIRREGWSHWLWLHSCRLWFVVDSDGSRIAEADTLTAEDFLAEDWTLAPPESGDTSECDKKEPCQYPALPDPGPYCVETPEGVWFNVAQPGCDPIRPRIEQGPVTSSLFELPPPLPAEPVDPYEPPGGSGDFGSGATF